MGAAEQPHTGTRKAWSSNIHTDDLVEYLIVPPGAHSAENFIRQEGKQLHFYLLNVLRPPHYSSTLVPNLAYENNPKINSSNGSPSILLFKKMPGRNQIVLDSTAAAFASQGSFFVWDDNRSYFVDYEQWVQNVFTMLSSHSARSFVDVPEFKGSIGIFTSRYKFHPHYHPFVELFTKQLNIFGLPGLLTRQLQIAPETVPGAPPRFEFSSYAPVSTIPTSIGKSTVSLSRAPSLALTRWRRWTSTTPALTLPTTGSFLPRSDVHSSAACR